jgi:hypothetical protein
VLQVKSCLILKYVKPDDRVFDLAMGKGGDLPKWKRARIGSYFGADIARDSVQEHARTRYNQVRNNSSLSLSLSLFLSLTLTLSLSLSLSLSLPRSPWCQPAPGA